MITQKSHLYSCSNQNEFTCVNCTCCGRRTFISPIVVSGSGSMDNTKHSRSKLVEVGCLSDHFSWELVFEWQIDAHGEQLCSRFARQRDFCRGAKSPCGSMLCWLALACQKTWRDSPKYWQAAISLAWAETQNTSLKESRCFSPQAIIIPLRINHLQYVCSHKTKLLFWNGRGVWGLCTSISLLRRV